MKGSDMAFLLIFSHHIALFCLNQSDCTKSFEFGLFTVYEVIFKRTPQILLIKKLMSFFRKKTVLFNNLFLSRIFQFFMFKVT